MNAKEIRLEKIGIIRELFNKYVGKKCTAKTAKGLIKLLGKDMLSIEEHIKGLELGTVQKIVDKTVKKKKLKGEKLFDFGYTKDVEENPQIYYSDDHKTIEEARAEEERLRDLHKDFKLIETWIYVGGEYAGKWK